MPFSQRKKRAYFQNRDRARKLQYNKEYYILNCERERVKARALYRADPGEKISAVRALYKTQPSKKSAANQADYELTLRRERLL